MEAKLTILDEAAKALGLYQRESLDSDIQSNKRESKTGDGNIQSRSIELSAETDVLIRKTLVKTKAMFSEPTYKALSKALNAPLSVEKASGVEHLDFITNSDIAIEMMGDELRKNQFDWICLLLKKIFKR